MVSIKKQEKTVYQVIIILLLVALIVMGFVTLKSLERKNLVETAVTQLCGEALTDIELNLRQGDELNPEYFYRLHEITSVYPDTNYARLSQVLLDLKDPALAQILPQESRDALADCIARTNTPNILDQELEPIIYEIQTLLAPYLYNEKGTAS